MKKLSKLAWIIEKRQNVIENWLIFSAGKIVHDVFGTVSQLHQIGTHWSCRVENYQKTFLITSRPLISFIPTVVVGTLEHLWRGTFSLESKRRSQLEADDESNCCFNEMIHHGTWFNNRSIVLSQGTSCLNQTSLSTKWIDWSFKRFYSIAISVRRKMFHCLFLIKPLDFDKSFSIRSIKKLLIR